MITYSLILLVIGAYLLGSIPSAVWLGKYFHGIDVREHGSKNAGATNTFRVLGWKTGVPVLLVDILKGFAAVSLIGFSDFSVNTAAYVNFQLILGTVAVVGHIFPVFAGFRGGKGVASLFGIVLAISLYPTLIAFSIFLIVLFAFKYVSLGSIMAGISFPFLVIFVFKSAVLSLVIFSIVVSILLIITHLKNIKRLLNNEESKASFLVKKN